MMSLFRAKAGDSSASKAHIVETARWSGGGVWASRTATVGLWGLFLAWPIVIALFVPGRGTNSDASPSKVAPIRSITEQSAGAVASGFVASWLSATKDDSTELDRYVSTAGRSLPDTGWVFRNLSVASVGEATSTGLIPVRIAADIEETSITTSSPATSWNTRYFAVTVRVAHDAVGIVGMPAPIAGPAPTIDQPHLDYGASVSLASPGGMTASSFLAAYLTGSGEVSRYVSPEVEIAPITPPPYAAIKVTEVAANAAPAEKPVDGATVNVLVKTELFSGTGQAISADYILTMRARAGRWEVSSINSTPTEITNIRK